MADGGCETEETQLEWEAQTNLYQKSLQRKFTTRRVFDRDSTLFRSLLGLIMRRRPERVRIGRIPVAEPQTSLYFFLFPFFFTLIAQH